MTVYVNTGKIIEIDTSARTCTITYGGAQGSPGTSAYLYVAWASDASGTDFTTTFNAALDYVAFKNSATVIAAPDASDFTGLWKNYKGATGASGDMAWKGEWTTSTLYKVNELVYHVKTGHGQSVYVCTSEHTSGASTEPEVGGSWDTVWELYSEGGADGADGEGMGDMLADGTVAMTGALTMTQIATPDEPAASKTAIYPKSDGKVYRYSNGGTETEIGSASFWTQETTFTATPASTSTLTMTADKTASILVGYPVKYAIGGTTYYGIVTAMAANLMTIAGAPMGGDVTALYYGDPTRVAQVDFFIPGAFADASNTGLLASDARTKFDWNLTKAYCVQIRHTVRVDDSGANQPRVTISIAGSVVGTSNTNAGEAVAETWTSTVVGINTTNYDINRDEAIEIVTDANGSNDDATDLTVSAIFVIP